MPMWARAIIFGIELVGFIILSIFAITKLYKHNYLKKGKKIAIKNLKFDLIYFSVNFAIILALFLLTFPSYVFLSYNKLLLVSIVELLLVIIILVALINNNKVKFVLTSLLTILSIALVIIIPGMMADMIKFEDKVAVLEKQETQTITPTMFSENQIGYIADKEGNVTSYIFYYKNNDEWEYVQANASEVEKVESNSEDSYVEKRTIRISYCKDEKKSSEEDYIYTVEYVKYTIYSNKNHMVKIKAN